MKKQLFTLFLCLSVAALSGCGGGDSQMLTQPLSIISSVPPNGTVGVGYGGTHEFSFKASGGKVPYVWDWSAVSGSSLPPGLSLSPESGTLSGTPVTEGTYDFTVKVRDSGLPANQASVTYTITVISVAPLVITSSNPPNAVVAAPYGGSSGFSLTASGGVAPYAWNWVAAGGSSLPPGLNLSPSTGVISGTATATGSYSFTVTVSDAESPPAGLSVEYGIFVSDTANLEITSGPLPPGKVGVPYGELHIVQGHQFRGFLLSATGGTSPYKWSATSLPPGLKITVLTFGGGNRCCRPIPVVDGTPSTAGDYNVEVKVSDSGSPQARASANYSVNIQP